MKATVTLQLDYELFLKARLVAAEEGTSVNAFLAALLSQLVEERKTYNRARKRALKRLRMGMVLRWKHPPARDELYER